MLTKRRAFDTKASCVEKPSCIKWVDFSPISQVTLGSLSVRCSDSEKIFPGLNRPKWKKAWRALKIYSHSLSMLCHNSVWLLAFHCGVRTFSKMVKSIRALYFRKHFIRKKKSTENWDVAARVFTWDVTRQLESFSEKKNPTFIFFFF